MEIQLHPDLEAKLAALAEQQGRDRAGLVVEAVERLVDHDAWFLREVNSGIAQVASGETLTHKQVGQLLEAHLSERQLRG
jgi:predicted transcriptional regulator